jgi:hypothetical protein
MAKREVVEEREVVAEREGREGMEGWKRRCGRCFRWTGVC